MTQISHTDAATELAELASYLRGLQNVEQHATNAVIHSQLRSGSEQFPVFRAYSAINRRADDLSKFISTVADPFVDESSRQYALKSVQMISAVFSPNNFQAPWHVTRNLSLTDEYILYLKSFARTVRVYRPLNKITAAQIQEIKKALGEAQSELKQKDLPEWASIPLSIGIDELIFVLNNFRFFGHDVAIDQILALRGSAGAAYVEAERKGYKPKMMQMAAAIALLIEVFSAPHDLADDIKTYRGWISHYASSERTLMAPTIKKNDDLKTEISSL